MHPISPDRPEAQRPIKALGLPVLSKRLCTKANFIFCGLFYYLCPVRKITDNENKKLRIADYQRKIMEVLGLDVTDPSIRDTPDRIAKMYVDEIFYGLDEKNKPAVTMFENNSGYNQMLVETDIAVASVCAHHWQNISGVCHIGYIPGKKIIGLSKLHRITDYFARRPQVQEQLTDEIFKFLQDNLMTEDVAVILTCVHNCVKHRGIKDQNSLTTTAALGGAFEAGEARAEFYTIVNMTKRK